MSPDAVIPDAVNPDPADVALSGEIDLSNVDLVMLDVRRAADTSGERVVVDLSAVTFFDSSAIRGLLTTDLDLRRAGVQMVVGEVSPMVERVLDITGAWSRLERARPAKGGSG